MKRGLKQRCDMRFRRIERAARLRLLVHALVSWLALVGMVVLVLTALLGWFDPPRWVRLGLVISGGILTAAGAVGVFTGPWRILRSRVTLARHCDRAGGYADTLTAAEEALRRPDRWRTDTPVRKALVERLLARAGGILHNLSLSGLIPVWRPAAIFLLSLAMIGAGTWLDQARPQILERGWSGLRSFWRPIDANAPGSLRLAPGPRHVIAGDDLTVAALDLHGGFEQVVCEVRAGSGLWQRMPAVPADAGGDDPVRGAPFERWEARLDRIAEDLVYRFRRGHRISEQRSLTVRHPPLLLELAGRIQPPRYTGLPTQEFSQLPGYIEVPAGSRLAFEGRANNMLDEAMMVSAGGDTVELVVRSELLMGELTVDAPMHLQPVLRDRRGLTGRGELIYEIAVLPDRLPAARLRRVDGDGYLPLTGSMALQAFAEDDYGLIAVDLQLRRGAVLPWAVADDDHWQSIALLDTSGVPRAGRRAVSTSLGELPMAVTPRPTLSTAVQMTLHLEADGLALVSGDVVELRLVAHDNRKPGPPGIGKSEILRLQVPSNLEVMRAGEESQSARGGDLQDLQRRSSSLSAELERLRRELLRNPVPEWDRRQVMQSAVQRQQDLQAELANLAESMRRDLESLGEQRLVSPELMDRMDRLADLLSEHRSGGMQELLERMREALADMSPQELAKAMEELQRNQVDMLRRMDAAQAMLRELAQQQQMEGLTELAADLMRKQQELADRVDDSGEMSMTEGTDKPQADQDSRAELARHQEALARELAALEERLEEALAELEERAATGTGDDTGAVDEMMRDALSEAQQQLQDLQTEKTMQEAADKLTMMPEEALKKMQEAMSDLAGLYHVFLRTQFAMTMAMKMEHGQQMRDLAADLLELSERQEQLGLDLPTTLRDVRRDDLVRRQHVVLQGAISLHEKLQAVAAAAPPEVMRMLQVLDELVETVGQTLNQLKEGRAQTSRHGSQASLASMNQLVIQLLTQAQITTQGSGSCDPQQQFGQQLQQMAQEQSGLNALAEQLRRQEGRLSQELRAGMQRLQQEQSQLAGRAQQLAEEEEILRQQQEGSRLLGDLGQVARDMETVSDELAGGLVTDETLRRQERILSRLLDMHNASRERDWARRRESRTAQEVYAEQPGDPRALDQALLAPEAQRWRAVDQAPSAYRELVRQYLRAVQLLHETTGRGPDGLPDGERSLP